jgi:hypothetical protein
MEAQPETQSNKKKRKISELITLYEPSKAPLPPPLEEPSPTMEQDENGEWRPVKRSKTCEIEDYTLNLPPPPQDESGVSKRKLKSTNSRPKISSVSSAERRLRERQRSEAANEILSSEKSYVATLEAFVNVREKDR